MPLLSVVFTLLVIGVILYLINRFVPMEAKIKAILVWVVIIAVVLWLLNLFGLFGHMSNIKVGS
jgi:hypothetical protein